MIFSFCLDRFNDIEISDPQLMQAQARILADNNYVVHRCRNEDGKMRVRFVKKKEGEIPVAITPGYQSTRVLAGRAWNDRECAMIYTYRLDRRFGMVSLAAQSFARRDHHVTGADVVAGTPDELAPRAGCPHQHHRAVVRVR